MSNTVNPQTVRSGETSSVGGNPCRVDHPVVDSATIRQEGIENPYHEQEIQNLCPGTSSRDEVRSFASLSLVGVLLLLDRIYRDLRNVLASRNLDQILRRVWAGYGDGVRAVEGGRIDGAGGEVTGFVSFCVSMAVVSTEKRLFGAPYRSLRLFPTAATDAVLDSDD